MAIATKFNRAPAGGKGAANKPKSKYAGIQAATPRDPMPHVGIYRFEVIDATEGYNPGKSRGSSKLTCKIVDLDDQAGENHKKDDQVNIVHLHTTAGLAECKAMIMAALGFEDEEAFNTFDQNSGQVIDACLGTANDFSDKVTIIGRLFDCQVTRGNDDGAGSYYRVYASATVAEDDQEIKAEWLP